MRRLLQENKRLAFWIGVALIASSFAIYPAYAVIALLPQPPQVKIAGAIVGSAISWAMFLLGTSLAGRRGVEYVKRRFMGETPPPPPPPPPDDPG